MRFTYTAATCSRVLVAAGAVALATVLPSSPVSAQESQRDTAFTWSGTLPAPGTLFIKNVNGGVAVERSTSGRVEVIGEKRWRRGNPEDVRIEQQKSGDNVVICALYQEGSTCDETGIKNNRRMRWNDRNDVTVRFIVKVPEGTHLDLSTVNGGVDVRDVTAAVRAVTVNGSITARSAGGPVYAKTVNGSIDVSMGSLGRAADLEYETVNGAITLEFPSNFGAELELRTVNGRVSTDFPITMSGTLSSRRLRGTIGDGRTRVRASTVNGAVTLRKGG
jgi:hypothetical protein